MSMRGGCLVSDAMVWWYGGVMVWAQWCDDVMNE
jgi:hypothetical protein